MGETGAVLAAIRDGDEQAFAVLGERYRRELHVHCYRMLGSFDDAEDLVQETLLRAWRGREGFEGRSQFRTWLYRIATNACLNALERTPRRVLPQDVVPPVTAETPASEARGTPPWAPEIPWLQPYPDSRLEVAAPHERRPDELLVARETFELAFLAALQELPGRQRAILILADVVGWSAAEIAELLELSVAAVTSALQRARATLDPRRPKARAPSEERAPSEDELTVLKRYMDAWERGDAVTLVELLREDARWAMPPARLWFEGRAAIENMLRLFPPNWQGRSYRMAATSANRQPATAAYMRSAGEAGYRLASIHALRIKHGEIAEITTFSPELCASFELPPTL